MSTKCSKCGTNHRWNKPCPEPPKAPSLLLGPLKSAIAAVNAEVTKLEKEHGILVELDMEEGPLHLQGARLRL